jgi:hypothetical protein
MDHGGAASRCQMAQQQSMDRVRRFMDTAYSRSRADTSARKPLSATKGQACGLRYMAHAPPDFRH